MITWILVFMLSTSEGAAITTIEYHDKGACYEAAATINSQVAYARATCIERK